MRGSRLSAIVLLALLGALCGGCVGTWPQREGIVLDRGVYVVHCPGIVGPMGHDQEWAYGLILGGVQDVECFNWTGPSPLDNLMNTKRHEEQAMRLVWRLRELNAELPEARIVVTGHSGGCRIVVSALEALTDEDDFVEQAWLMAPALSPEYDLNRSLEEVGRMVVVSSPGDWLILGVGTNLLGTSDRERTKSAGMVGFRGSHPRLEQWRYDSAWRALGNTGDHMTCLGHRFAAKVVGPEMVGWDPAFAWPMEVPSYGR